MMLCPPMHVISFVTKYLGQILLFEILVDFICELLKLTSFVLLFGHTIFCIYRFGVFSSNGSFWERIQAKHGGKLLLYSQTIFSVC